MKFISTRRDFLKGSILTVSACWLSACASQVDPLLKNDSSANYYIQRRQDILDENKPYLLEIQKILKKEYGENEASDCTARVRRQFDELLKTLPDIGGDANVLTSTLIQSALALAFYQVTKQSGIPLEESGRMIYQATRALVFKPEVMGGADTKIANSQSARVHYQKTAAWSQQRLYAQDWVYSYVEGDGSNFDYGVDYTECALCKFYKSQDAIEFAPYLCLGDYLISQNYETGLQRTQTLARGGACCDFRFKTGRQPRIEWMPDFMFQG